MNLHIAFCTCNFALIWGIRKHETLSKQQRYFVKNLNGSLHLD